PERRSPDRSSACYGSSPHEIAITHYLVAAEYLGVELEGAIHVVDRNTEMLHSLEAGAEGCAVAVSRDGSPAWTAGALGKRRDARCGGGGSNPPELGPPRRAAEGPADKGGHQHWSLGPG